MKSELSSKWLHVRNSSLSVFLGRLLAWRHFCLYLAVRVEAGTVRWWPPFGSERKATFPNGRGGPWIAICPLATRSLLCALLPNAAQMLCMFTLNYKKKNPQRLCSKTLLILCDSASQTFYSKYHLKHT